MRRETHGWHIVEICRVISDTGHEGLGETLPNYTWGKVGKDALDRARKKNPFELLWDDSLGAGLQMAILDLCGKIAEVPAYRLLGTKVRDWCPISWWNIDMSPEDYASETRSALADGYRSFKQKARPWWDVYEQARLCANEVDEDFELVFDFNEHLNNAGAAISVLKRLDEFPQMAIYESPIPQADVEGNKRIRQNTRCAIAMHYDNPPVGTAYKEQACDGFVGRGGLTSFSKISRFTQQVNMPFWIQLVGTGITTSLAAHIGAVSSHAQWPAVTCMNLYEDQLITEPISIENGYYRVNESPGLGIRLNEDCLKWKTDSSDLALIDAHNNKALFAIVYANGHRIWFNSSMKTGGFCKDNHQGNQPLFQKGVHLETWENDGSQEWQALRDRVMEGPVRESV